MSEEEGVVISNTSERVGAYKDAKAIKEGLK